LGRRGKPSTGTAGKQDFLSHAEAQRKGWRLGQDEDARGLPAFGSASQPEAGKRRPALAGD